MSWKTVAPFGSGAGWLEPLLAYPGRVDVSLHVEPLAPAVAAERLRKQRGRLESSRRSDASKGKLDDPSLEAAAADAAELAGRLAHGEGRLFRCGLYLTVHAADEQELAANATIIISVGQQTGVPQRGWVIAAATAMRESNLVNLGHLGDDNDHDSLGLFQQRPSQGWGSPEQILNPEYAAGVFYERLLEVPGWEDLPPTVAAQEVQRSAYPNAYTRHEPRATRIVEACSFRERMGKFRKILSNA